MISMGNGCHASHKKRLANVSGDTNIASIEIFQALMQGPTPNPR